ncbi:uncharacterized protein LOC113005834 [Solenopsis invicta]|uniref:uncharacterized protein LOC113005834 n=1 Tax=Solenopsis invicta TaxID=13686 RepID=UPI00193C9091|nr:uncharacterized protein LOC113005834 [Solenopsis invicta]
MDLLTSSDDLDRIEPYDSTVEIIGYVDGIDAPRYVGDKRQYKVLKLFLNNGSGKRVQVITWNDKIDRIESHIKFNCVIHLDGALAQPAKLVQFNNGNMPYKLQIQSNTKISCLGKFKFENITNQPESEKINFSEVLNTTTRVTLKAYIKTNFASFYNNKLNKKIGCGSITDGKYKLEIHFLNFNDENYDYLDLKKDDKIKIIGSIQKTGKT